MDTTTNSIYDNYSPQNNDRMSSQTLNMSHKSNIRIRDEHVMQQQQQPSQQQSQQWPSCGNSILLASTSCSCFQCSCSGRFSGSSSNDSDSSNDSRDESSSNSGSRNSASKQDMFAETTITTKGNRIKQQTTESEFYKFLGRFSGRRRFQHLQRILQHLSLSITSILILISLCSVTEACSSRTTPKPRPPPTTTPRPNITFHTYKCPPAYAAWYCLNEATCFTVKIGDEILYNCECADGYMGPRCEYKDLDGSYLPTRPRVMLETASIASGATLALILVLILCLCLYVKCHERRKRERLAEDVELDVDTVDGGVVHVALRPFGPHHHGTLPMTAMLKR